MGRCAGHVADQVNDRIAVLDVVIQLVQGLGAGGDEVLLHLDRDVGARQVMAQGLAVAAKLRTDNRQKKLYVGQGSSPSARLSSYVLSGP